jgi:hypothetical protein
MRTINSRKLLVTIVSLVFTFGSFAQTPEESVKETYQAFDTAKTYNQQAPVVNQFKLIATKWPDNWLCNYYAALSIGILSFQEPDSKKKDPMLDEADTYFEKIKTMTSNNEEVNILGSLLAQARISVKSSRYKKYGDMGKAYLDKAKSLNPNSPRIYYMEANSLYYTPKMFGGGADKALPLYEKAADLFAKEQKSDISKPYWGNAQNQQMINLCKSDMQAK